MDNGLSKDVEWEEGKLAKDYGDTVALIDGSEPLDPEIISRSFTDFPFLKIIIERLAEDPNLYRSYAQNMTNEKNEITRKISLIRINF